MSRIRFNRESGVSLISAVVLLGVVLLVGGGIYQATTTSKQSMDQAKRTGDAGTLSDMTIEHLRQVIMDSGSAKSQGICRLFNTPMLSVGTGNIYLRLPATNSEDPLLADWNRAFPPAQWQPVASAHGCKQDAFTRCFTPKASSPGNPAIPGMSETFLARKPVVIATIVPMNMRNTSGRAVDPVSMSPSSPTTVNARDIGFVVSSKIVWPQCI